MFSFQGSDVKSRPQQSINPLDGTQEDNNNGNEILSAYLTQKQWTLLPQVSHYASAKFKTSLDWLFNRSSTLCVPFLRVKPTPTRYSVFTFSKLSTYFLHS